MDTLQCTLDFDSPSQTIPIGFCQCGCGQRTRISHKTDNRAGWIKGHPLRFIYGHNVTKVNSIQNIWDRVNVGTPDECWLWTTSRDSHGYGIFSGNYRKIRVTRCVYDLCYGIKNPKSEICHACDVPLCCNPLHLFEGSHLDNMRDKVSKNRHLRGSATKGSILNETQIPEIRTLLSNGYTTVEIGKKFGVSPAAIRSIRRGKNWKHVP